ncbi:MAG: N,N-dimethylformamidase beta subunit family domain-containing protein [Pirellula sp.]
MIVKLTACCPMLACLVTIYAMVHTDRRAEADQLTPAAPFIAGYPNRQSFLPGEEISFHLCSTEKIASVKISRMGPVPEIVWEREIKDLAVHAIPDKASSHGCNWPSTFQVKIPAEWKSGYYQAVATVVSDPKLSDDPKASKEPKTVRANMYFVVRSPSPGTASRILIQLSTNTYNAYTNWGGHSLYAYHDRDGVQGHRVSFQRPQSSQFENWEGPFVRWAESNGFILDYATNADLEFQPELLRHYRLVLSVGHDEYWSSAMRDNLEAYIEKGGNVAFFSGNTCCWQVRSEDNGQALTCWKQWYNVDPMFRTDKQHLLSTAWSHHLIGRPENKLTGVGFLWGGYHRSHGQFMDGPASYEVHRPDHWLFEGTRLARGDRFGGKDTIVGYECDGCEMKWIDGLPVPTGSDGTPENFTILASCPAKWAPDDAFWYDRFPKDRVGAAVLGMYTRGGTVVTVGSTDWAHGLKGNDPFVQQITKNVLTKLGKDAK